MILYKKRVNGNAASDTDNNRLMLRMVTSYSIFLLVILGLSIYLYLSTANNMRSQFQEQNLAMLRSSTMLVDRDFNIMDIFSRQLLQDNTFLHLASAKAPVTKFYLEGFSTKKELASNMYPEVLLPINEYYIHLEKTKYLLASSHFVERSLFYSGTRAYPAKLYDRWVEMLENPEYHNTFLSLDDFILNPQLHYYLYIMDLNELTERNVPATACFVIDAEKLGSLFKGIEFYGTGYMLITDSEGNVLYALSDRKDPYSREGYDASSLKELPFSNNFAELNQDGRKMLVTRQISPSGDLYYYLVQPASASMLSFRPYSSCFSCA